MAQSTVPMTAALRDCNSDCHLVEKKVCERVNLMGFVMAYQKEILLAPKMEHLLGTPMEPELD